MKRRTLAWIVTLMLATLVVSGGTDVRAESRAELESNARNALKNLYAGNTAAKLIGEKATAVLVFPNIVKAGFMFGGQLGDGMLFRGSKAVDTYNSVAASWGLQAGLQVYGYALFFMTEKALAYLDKSEGFEIGVGPSVVVVDAGVGKSMTSTTLKDDIYAFIFDQKGLMAGIGIQGAKITKTHKK